MPKNPDPSLMVTSTAGVERTLDDLTTMFQLCLVVLPGRAEANRYLPVARRIFATFGDSDAACAFLVTGSDEVARRILGEDATRWLTFVDPDNAVVDSLGLERLPALVHLQQDTSIGAVAEGWDPTAWQRVVREIGKSLAWTVPEVAGRGDPPKGTDWPVAAA